MTDRNQKKINRREFLKNSALSIAVLSTPVWLSSCSRGSGSGKMPTRILGKTGLEVSVLAFGGGSQFQKNADGEWELLLERALKLGINYFDTASDYSYRRSLHSEERYGRILTKYRDKVIIATKFNSRKVDEMMREFEESLKRLNTDYVDILLIHSIEKSEDIDYLEKGVYRRMLQLKDEKVVRFIGFSSMNSARKSKEFIEKLDPDVALLAINPTKYGDFAEIALPVARKKNIGVLGMKIMRDLVGKEGTTAKELLTYALTQPGVAGAVIGHYGMKVLEENAHLVKEIVNTSALALNFNREDLEARLARYAGPHALCWARPGYRDGLLA